jgi:hypothetical protein
MMIMFVIYIHNFDLKERLNSQKSPKKADGCSKQIFTKFFYRQMIGVVMVGTLPC